MILFSRAKRQWLRFKLEETGSVIVEMMLMMPILVWALVANVQFFDAYRANLIATKATLTMADMLSREASIDTSYLNGMHSLLKFLSRADDLPDYRVTVFYSKSEFDVENQNYEVVWSKGSAGRLARTKDQLAAMRGSIPILSLDERAILVETWTDYEPQYGKGIGKFVNKGLTTLEYSNALVISPRFTASLCFNDTPLNPSVAQC